MLKSFSVTNYRAFARQQTIECRPLTLFFGRNSSGKSALIRFLPLLVESFQANAPIYLGGKIGRKADWRDMVCKATNRDTLDFSLEWQDKPVLNAHWWVEGDFEGRWRTVDILPMLHMANPTQAIQYEFQNDDSWRGLLPTQAQKGLPTEPAAIEALKLQAQELCGQVQWISGVRAQPERFVSHESEELTGLDSDGGNAILHLLAAYTRSTVDPLLALPRSFFKALGETLVLDHLVRHLWRVALAPTGREALAIDLCDTGEGYTQVLPILVALARACNGGPRLLCLEQPELHLHTHAQAELANVLVATANDTAKPQLLVETHSEVLLTSVQLAIAEGRIKQDMVRVYWVAARGDGTSEAMPVDFDGQGRPTNAKLMRAFDAATRLGRALMRVQMEKFNVEQQG
jgi:hypothetical protein